MIYTNENVRRVVELAFGPEQIGQGRAHDTARRILEGSIDPPNAAAAEYLVQVRSEAEEREARRVARAQIKANETAASWREFKDRLESLSATPDGFVDISVRNEATGQLLRLRIPETMILT